MSSKIILLLIGAAIISLLVAAFQYFYKAKKGTNKNPFFALLRFLSVFTLLVLLINPKINIVTTSVEKPDLVVLADQSASIAHLGQKEKLKGVLNKLSKDQTLNEKFDVSVYGFGNTLYDSLTDENRPQTRISYALKNIQKIHRKPNTAIVLLTDGNQTYGSDFSYYKSRKNQPIYAVAFGDTVDVEDVKISRVNANKYAYLNNTFPIEVLVNYNGDNEEKVTLNIYKEKQLIHKEAIRFSESKKSHFSKIKIKANAPAGVHTYKATVTPISGEKNKNNNTKAFVIETIDQKASILLVSDIAHPDIAALKRSIETNKRRELVIKRPNEVKNIDDFQMLILYQPKSNFKSIYDIAENAKMQTFTITGRHTDWGFLNKQNKPYKKSLKNQLLEVLPVLNNQFESFNTEQFSFSNLPPLETNFGQETLSGNYETLIAKKIQGVETEYPLLAFWNSDTNNEAVLFAEGIWKWRMYDYKNNENFENFDAFFGKIIQSLSSKQKRKRLTVNFESVYYSNNLVKVTASYFNKSYEFDNSAKLILSLTTKNNSFVKKIPMVLKGQFYEADLSNLSPGNYSFSVSTRDSDLKESGSFTILDFEIEKQFYNANKESLNQLVNKNGGILFYPNQMDNMVTNLMKSESLKPIQKYKKDVKNLISWKYLLGLLILFLSLEWFLRKYRGLI